MVGDEWFATRLDPTLFVSFLNNDNSSVSVSNRPSISLYTRIRTIGQDTGSRQMVSSTSRLFISPTSITTTNNSRLSTLQIFDIFRDPFSTILQILLILITIDPATGGSKSIWSEPSLATMHDCTISLSSAIFTTLIVDFSHSGRSCFRCIGARKAHRKFRETRGANSKFEALGREEDARRQAVCSYSVSDL